jgi:hypothetical protein
LRRSLQYGQNDTFQERKIDKHTEEQNK